jgi:hypothetical protein
VRAAPAAAASDWSLAAGIEQAGLFTRLQAPVARTATGRPLDVAHRVVDMDAPFLARHLEDMVYEFIRW